MKVAIHHTLIVLLGGACVAQTYFAATRDLAPASGWHYWGGQEPEYELHLGYCCENESGCFDVVISCANYGQTNCLGAESYTKYNVNNRKKCVDGYPGNRQCQQEKPEYWVNCARYNLCVWDAGIGECVEDEGQEVFIRVPLSCTDWACP